MSKYLKLLNGKTVSSAISLTADVTGILPIANGGTNAGTKASAFDNLSPMSALGDIIYGDTSGTGTALTGNITSTKKFLTQTGTGSVSAAPAWNTIAAGDIPTLNQNTTGTAANITASSNATLTTLSALTTATSLVSVGTITTGVWTGTTIAIANGGTGVSSATTTPTASAFSAWDANSNLSANSFIEGYATTATAGATTTLLVSDKFLQFFTGSTTQTVKLPVASTLVLGQQFLIANNSTGVVTVQSSGSNTIQAMVGGSSAIFTCILTSGTTAASWSVSYIPAFASTNTASTAVVRDGSGNFSAGTITAALTGTASGNTTYTPNNHGVVVSGPANAMTVITPNASTAFPLISGGTGADPTWAKLSEAGGGTNQTAYTTGDILYASGTNTLSKLAIGSTGNVLTVSGGIPAWAAASGSATNATVDTFSGDNSTVAFTLSVSPGSVNNAQVYISGVYQQKANYTISGATLTFVTAPPTGTNNIQVVSGSTLSVGTPSDGTVTKAKLASGAKAVNVVTKTTTYTAVADDYILVSASAGWTLTLPTAVGISGQYIYVQRTDNSPSNVITINTTSSQSIGSYGTSVHVSTQGEVWVFISDGTNWQVQEHQTETSWVVSTLTPGATTTAPTLTTNVTHNVFQWKRQGSEILYEYTIKTVNGGGTNGTGTYKFLLPNSLAFHSDVKVNATGGFYSGGTYLGDGEAFNSATVNNGHLRIYAFDSNNFFAIVNGNNGDLSATNIGLNNGAGTVATSFKARAKIANWED